MRIGRGIRKGVDAQVKKKRAEMRTLGYASGDGQRVRKSLANANANTPIPDEVLHPRTGRKRTPTGNRLNN